MKKIILTVTTDLNFDQRMMRICGSLAANGYEVELVGRKRRTSLPLQKTTYRQKRLSCWFDKGKLFYAEYNIRLFFYLLFRKADCICAIDLDTILPVYYISRLKGIKRTYDAHEYFSQLNEVITRPSIYKFWHGIERKMLPRFPKAYTVCEGLALEFEKHYGVKYEIIRSVPLLNSTEPNNSTKKFILYQGAVNKGRGLDKMIEAMKLVNAPMVVCGDGNFMDQLKTIVRSLGLEEKVELKGMLLPADLKKVTNQAYIAINPFEATGLNQYLSLPNKFFDYIHACVPQVTMNYPEYRTINRQFEVALLIDNLEPETIAEAINRLLYDGELHSRLKRNCAAAREELNWQKEEKKLIQFYHNFLNG